MLPLESRSGPENGLPGPAPSQHSSSPYSKAHLTDSAARRAMLIAEHDDLDCAIAALLDANNHDDLLIRRLKKRKLHLKDEIAQP